MKKQNVTGQIIIKGIKDQPVTIKYTGSPLIYVLLCLVIIFLCIVAIIVKTHI